ncbi:hypothetical protein MMC26_005313 [Xylographa opegraphella]|nr:hypothetical protein [Xylographa opegraphella]
MASSIETTSASDIFLDLVPFTVIGCAVGFLVLLWRPRVKEALETARAGAIPRRKWSCSVIIFVIAFDGILECILFFQFLYALSTVLDNASKDERYSGGIWDAIHFLMFFIYGITWGMSLALCIFGFFKFVTILLELHGLTVWLLPRKRSTSSEASVPTEVDTDVEVQLDHLRSIEVSTTGNQHLSCGEPERQSETVERVVEANLAEHQTISRHPVEDDSNPGRRLPSTTYSQDQDTESAGEESGNRSEVYTPPTSSGSEAGDFHSLNHGSSDSSSDGGNMSEDADDTSALYAALAQRLDAEVDDIDSERPGDST